MKEKLSSNQVDPKQCWSMVKERQFSQQLVRTVVYVLVTNVCRCHVFLFVFRVTQGTSITTISDCVIATIQVTEHQSASWRFE